MATRSCVPSARTQSVKRLAQSAALRFQPGRRAALCASHSSSALTTDWGSSLRVDRSPKLVIIVINQKRFVLH